MKIAGAQVPTVGKKSVVLFYFIKIDVKLQKHMYSPQINKQTRHVYNKF